MDGRKVVAAVLLSSFVMAALMPPMAEAHDDVTKTAESNDDAKKTAESNACSDNCHNECNEQSSSYLGVSQGFCLAKCYATCGVDVIKDKFNEGDIKETTS